MKKAAPKRVNKTMTAIGGVFGLILAYAFVSRAFSTGSYWHYLTSVLLFILGIKLLVRTFKTYDKPSKTR